MEFFYSILGGLLLATLTSAGVCVLVAHQRCARLKAQLTDLAGQVRSADTTATEVFETTDEKRTRLQGAMRTILDNMEKDDDRLVRLNFCTKKRLETLFSDIRVKTNHLRALGYSAEIKKSLSSEDIARKVEAARDDLRITNFFER